MEISLFASAVRTKLWPRFLKSMENCSVPWEVVFSGNKMPDESHPQLRHILTGNIKPAQCYALALKNCIGETVCWTADDAEAVGDIYGKAYTYWKSKNNHKLILSLQSCESGQWQDMTQHTFFGGDVDSPLMAPFCLMSRKFLEDLGGIDIRYVSGQYENDIVMRALRVGATVEIFGDKENYIDVDHVNKSIECGEIGDKQDFINRPFAQGYGIDRMVLESSWSKPNYVKLLLAMRNENCVVLNKDFKEILDNPTTPFEPYPDEIPKDHSLSNKGWWE